MSQINEKITEGGQRSQKVTIANCPHAIGFQCGHPQWLKTNGRPWLYCKAVREIKLGCPGVRR